MKSMVQYSTYPLTEHLHELSYTQITEYPWFITRLQNIDEMSKTVTNVFRTNKCTLHIKYNFGALAILKEKFPS
jgi:hypothetical protein